MVPLRLLNEQPPITWPQATPWLALAPMQDVTDLPFWKLLSAYGGPDLFFTEYFRVHAVSRLDKDILRGVTENTTGKPVVAQIAGEDIPSLVRIARALQSYPVAAIDLNLGCPAPIVCRKNAGGGLLRNPPKVDAILGALREAIKIRFTVKCRLGWESPDEFSALLDIFAKHQLDLVTVHGRTVRQMYGGQVRYDLIGQAVASLRCPVLVNGDLDTAEKVVAVLAQTGAAGVMIGRGAVRNPWIFNQIRQVLRGEIPTQPTGREVGDFLRGLFEAVGPALIHPRAQIEKFKKYLNFIGPAIDPNGEFIFRARRMAAENEFHDLCAEYLSHDRPMLLTLTNRPAPELCGD
jgi:tRNA-dihydrouridine synthase